MDAKGLADRLLRAVGRFRRGARGSVMIMTAMMLPALMLAVGGAVDIANATRFKHAAQRTMDATVIALARRGDEESQLDSAGRALFLQLMRERGFDVAVSDLSFRSHTGEKGAPGVMGEGEIAAPSWFLGVIGVDAVPVSVAATAVAARAVPVEVALVLDVSGSMAAALNGSTRLAQMQAAVEGMLTALENSDEVEAAVSVTPYSTSVNIGGIDGLALESTSLRGGRPPHVGADVWAAERGAGGNRRELDASPAALATPFLGAGEPGAGSPRARMRPLTRDLAAVRADVRALTAGGGTAGHLGMAWGYYALSPRWSSVWREDPRHYGEARKVLVFLSDGAFNVTHKRGGAGSDSYARFQEACAAAKEKGVEVYTVALSLNPAHERPLKQCAEGGAGRFYAADSAAELIEAFGDIARKVGRLRLSG